jgi:hypothetical protein
MPPCPEDCSTRSAGQPRLTPPPALPPLAGPALPRPQLGGAPLLLREYMRLFTNACRLVLLLKHLPRKDIVQVRGSCRRGQRAVHHTSQLRMLCPRCPFPAHTDSRACPHATALIH